MKLISISHRQSLLPFKAHPVWRVVILSLCIVIADLAFASDKDYLLLINEEAESGNGATKPRNNTATRKTDAFKENSTSPNQTSSVDGNINASSNVNVNANTKLNTSADKKTNLTETDAPQSNTQPQEDEATFIMQVYSKLNKAQQNTLEPEERYLKQLELEARNLPIPATAYKTKKPANNGAEEIPPPSKSSTKEFSDHSASSQAHTAALPVQDKETPETQWKNLETALQKRMPTIYRFYRQLNLTDKRQVFENYAQTNRLSTASLTVLRLYTGQ